MISNIQLVSVDVLSNEGTCKLFSFDDNSLASQFLGHKFAHTGSVTSQGRKCFFARFKEAFTSPEVCRKRRSPSYHHLLYFRHIGLTRQFCRFYMHCGK